MIRTGLACSHEIAQALAAGQPVVALESTVIAQGLPWPVNLGTARGMEAAIRSAGAIPATIAILRGVPTIGLSEDELAFLARAPDVHKASRRDLGPAMGLGRTAATTVSATMALAHCAGIRVFATGGIGGAHRISQTLETCTPAELFDVSADLTELGRTPVLVVCAGAKSILDLPRTLEILETLGVPVVGYRTDEFPAFTAARSGLKVSARVEMPQEAAMIFNAHLHYGGPCGGGMLLCQQCPAEAAIDPSDFTDWLRRVESEARQGQVHGPELTPFLLSRLAEISGGRTLTANRALLIANARLAAEVAIHLASTSRVIGQPAIQK